MNRLAPLVVCFFGPESTGKTTMAQLIAARFNAVRVPEVSRELIDSNAFTVSDIERIGHAQLQRMQDGELNADRLVVCDTDLITTTIYSEHYLGTVPPVLSSLEQQQHIDRYFLFDIDVPWVADGLRDLGSQRELMMEKFRSALERRGLAYTLVQGDYQAREEFIAKEIEEMLRQQSAG
ncbi:MAG: AAA family ATPase [Bacteroidota bacterium]